MRLKRAFLVQTLAILFSLGGSLLAQTCYALPQIRILATGGGIAGVQADVRSAAHTAASLPIDSLVNSVPVVEQLATLKTEQFANLGSQNMDEQTWLRLARRVSDLQQQSDVDGIVITHGTDTLEETGYFLNLVNRSPKPVVLVGAMRPATAISADGPMNFYNAVAVAGDAEARDRGVLVVMNDEIHSAQDVQQRNTARLDAFQSPNRGRVGVVNTGAASFYSKSPSRPAEFSLTGLSQLPRVDIVYAHAGMRRELIDAAVATGARGIVLAGVGDGNAPSAALAALADAARKGIAVVRSSRTGSGRVTRNMEVADDKLGFVAALDLNPPKARILLMLGLSRTRDIGKLQEIFTHY